MTVKVCPEALDYPCPSRYTTTRLTRCEDFGVCQRSELAACERQPHRAGGRNRLPVVTMAGLRSVLCYVPITVRRGR